jgi:hypothetical protein
MFICSLLCSLENSNVVKGERKIRDDEIFTNFRKSTKFRKIQQKNSRHFAKLRIYPFGTLHNMIYIGTVFGYLDFLTFFASRTIRQLTTTHTLNYYC